MKFNKNSTTTRSAILVYNPRSGRGKSTERAQALQTEFQNRLGVPLMLRATRSIDDLPIAVKEALAFDIMIFMGGDGTLSECLQVCCAENHFKPLKKPVGLLPAGTGNSFIRDFGLTNFSEAKEALFEALEKNYTMDIDAAMIQYTSLPHDKPELTKCRIVINIWGVGLVAEIAELAMKMRFIGSLNYTLAALTKILSHRIKNWKMKTDHSQPENILANFVVVSNSRFTGGAMEIAPDIRVNDGRLFLVLPKILNRLNLLSTFPKIFQGEHVNHPQIETQFIEKLSIDSDDPVLMLIDGEVEPALNPTIEIRKSFWKMYVNPKRLL